MTATLDYLGVKPCGCAVAWISGDNIKRDTAREVAKWIRLDYDVQRVTTDDARTRLRQCVHGPRPMTQEGLGL